MGRHGGIGSTLSAKKKNISRIFGIPSGKIPTRRIINATEIRVPDPRGITRPGLTFKIGPKWGAKPGIRTAPTVEKALKWSKQTDPKLFIPKKRKK